jgi:homoserine O-acetyltransferase/O-succinyltransferase
MGGTLSRYGEARRADRRYRSGDSFVLFIEALVEAITSDPGFNKGFYSSPAEVQEGLLRHAKIWAVMGWSTEFFQRGRHKALGFSSVDDFIINFMYAYFSPMDPNDLLCMAWKAHRADVSRHTGGDLRAALNRVKAQTFVMPLSSDMFFPPADCQAEWPGLKQCACRSPPLTR